MNNFEPTFEPTLGVKDTVVNVKSFVKAHKQEYKALFKSILPYLLILVPISMYVSYITSLKVIEFITNNVSNIRTLEDSLQFVRESNALIYADPISWFGILISILIGYCFAVMAVSWHRLVLLGEDNYEPMSFLKPKKHEIDFVVMWTLLGVIIPHMMGVFMNLSALHVVLSLLVLPYLLFKLSFYFPAKAVNSQMKLRASFKLTKGYFWKFLFSLIRVMFKLFIVLIVISVVVGILGGAITRIVFVDEITSEVLRGAYSQMVTQAMQQAIILLVFQPIITILGVSVLSNYFQYALQNKQVAVGSNK